MPDPTEPQHNHDKYLPQLMYHPVPFPPPAMPSALLPPPTPLRPASPTCPLTATQPI